ncbi:MAG: PBP1A family penicillin-binding protein [Treponemataceae bacterium]|nr:PBP1A family penicillin-binding protein [Treponemataceae bacterium]
MKKIKTGTIVLLCGVAFFTVLCGICLGLLLSNTVNTINTEQFTEFNPALPTRLLDINGEVITEFASDEKREMISLNELPQHMIDALITREDQVFYKHPGFSLKALFRAVVGQLTGKSLGGGSTLTQQIAGTLYCDRSEKSVLRKLKELWWAIQMERRYSKDEILELYLNKIYFGAGTYGVSAASKYYFGHDVTEITPAEAAILVIQLSNPARFNPFNHPNRAMNRQQNVLTNMVANGYISQEIADASFEDYWLNFDYTRIDSSAYFMREDKAPWFSEYVLRELTSMIYGNLDIYTGGFTVNTTVNLEHQNAAQEVMESRIAYANRAYQRSSGSRKSDASQTYIPFTELMSLVFNLPDLKVSQERNENIARSTYNTEINPILDVMSLVCGVEPVKVGIVNRANVTISKDSKKNTIEGALITLDNETGYITALVGGSKFSSDNQFIRATQAKLQPGSSCKPLYYSAAIDSRKFTPATMIVDAPIVFYTEDGAPYYPENFRGEWKGSVQLWYALATSMNVPSLTILKGIGFDAAINRIVALLGLDEKEASTRGFARGYPLGLGVFSARPIEMARAFTIFANGGKETTPIAIRSVEDRNGKTFLNPERDIRLEQKRKGSAIQVISPQTAFIMTDLLQNVLTTPGGSLAGTAGGIKKFTYTDENGKKRVMPAAGKTGTTQNWSDAWTVGFTPYVTTAVWFGFDQKGKSLGLDQTGATLAGVAWSNYMRIIHENLPIKQFNKPQTGLVEATVCSVTGQLLTDACGNHQTTQFFLEGTQPKVMCELHSTRNEVKVVGVERLANEHILSGEKSAKINDKKQLILDLSFLGKLEPESAKSKKTSSTKSTSSSAKKTSSNISNKDLNTWFEDDNSSDAVNETDGEEFNFLLE